MKAQEIINKIENLIKEIADSNNSVIQRDLIDDPFEPVYLNICGIMYSYVSAEVIGQHEYHMGEDIDKSCDIRLYLQREDDLGARGEAEAIEFVASLKYMEKWAQSLNKYLEENPDEEEGFGQIANYYFTKASEYPVRSKERSLYWEIAMAFHYNNDSVQEAIRHLEKRIKDAEKSIEDGESSDYLNETWQNRIERYKNAIETLKKEQGEK